MNGPAYDLGPRLAHVNVRPFDLAGEHAGYYLVCNECGQDASAYLSHLRADPECVARWVAEHRRCGEGG